jgi:hypothetical protein
LAALAKKPSGGAIAAVAAAANAMQPSGGARMSNTALGIAAVAMTSSLATSKPCPPIEVKAKQEDEEVFVKQVSISPIFYLQLVQSKLL